MKIMAWRISALAGIFFCLGKIYATDAPEVEAETDQATKLAKELSNPISSLISIPFQANEDFGYGPSHNGYKFTLNIQPVIPISLNKDWDLILRTIVPVVSQHDLFFIENLPKNSPLQPQNRSQDGLSDTTQSFFFSPKNPGPFGLIWGIGPALLYPTGTHPFFGTGTFSIGPTVVGLERIGRTDGGCVDEPALVRLYRRSPKELQPAFPSTFHCIHTKDSHDFHLQFRSVGQLEHIR